jgi:hypothetical protein
MTEVLFYHLQNMPLESVLPPLLEKSLERGWRVVVQATSQERADALDAHLWTYRDDSFLPHTTWRSGDAQHQPIVLVVEEGNPNRANVRFLSTMRLCPRTVRPMSGWFWSLMATTAMHSRRPGAPGPIARRGGSKSRIGRPTKGADGSGGNSDIGQLMIICGFGRRACR